MSSRLNVISYLVIGTRKLKCKFSSNGVRTIAALLKESQSFLAFVAMRFDESEICRENAFITSPKNSSNFTKFEGALTESLITMIAPLPLSVKGLTAIEVGINFLPSKSAPASSAIPLDFLIKINCLGEVVSSSFLFKIKAGALSFDFQAETFPLHTLDEFWKYLAKFIL